MAFQDLKPYRIGETIQAVYPPVFISVGLVGNVLSIAVLCQRKNRRGSTAVLLTGLAAADSLVLILVLTEKWVHAMFDLDLRATSPGACKTHVLLTYTLLQLSPWYLVAITIERVCCVRYPHRVKNVFTPKSALFILAGICLVLLAINSHILYGMDAITFSDDNATACVPRDNYMDFMYRVWPWLDVCLMFTVPFVILIIGNILIYRALKSSLLFSRSVDGSTTKRQTRSGNVNNGTIHMTRSSKSLVKFTSSKMLTTKNSVNGRFTKRDFDHNSVSRTRSISNVSSQRSRHVRPSSFFTLTMFMLNICFILCVSPASVFTIGQTYWYPSPLSDNDNAELYLISRICFMFLYLNNVINFFLYILLGPKFRKDVLKIIGKLRCLFPCSKTYRITLHINSSVTAWTTDHRHRSSRRSS